MPERPEGTEPRDRPEPPAWRGDSDGRREKKVFGNNPGQTISRVLLILGVLLMLWVVYVISKAMG